MSISLFITFGVYGQTIRLNYTKQPLNEILLDLNQRYQIQISVNANLSSNCVISIKKQFASTDEALEALAKKCDLQLVKISNVYTFRQPVPVKPKPIVKKEKPAFYTYRGVVVESNSQEPLPYTLIQFTNGHVVTDENGYFAFKSPQKNVTAQFRHLGYQVTNTLLLPGQVSKVALLSQPQLLEEVVVTSKPTLQEVRQEIPRTRLGQDAGHIAFNDIANNLMPGNSDNLIFNNLRMYPGVMAAGESITDYVIWGSYAGQNHVIYDGITLFNSWGINDDIGRVNPYMVKNVNLYKGGYNVPYGERVGGVIMIDGRSGDRQKPELGISLSNQLANGYINVPLFNNRVSLQLAGRKTYYELLDLSSTPQADNEFIVPAYDYSDFNLKFTASLFLQDRFEVSLIGSQDSYNGTFTSELRRRTIEDIQVSSRQAGSSIKYVKSWKNKGVTDLSFSQSEYKPELKTNYSVKAPFPGLPDTIKSFNWANTVSEQTARLTHRLPAVNHHQLQLSVGWINQATSVSSQSTQRVLEDIKSQQTRWSLYALDEMQWGALSLNLGLKADFTQFEATPYLQPRVNGRFKINPKWNINFGWGIYNQFVSKYSVIDEIGNQRDVWQTSNGNAFPVLRAIHQVVGVSYLTHQWEISLEGHFNTFDGANRYFIGRNGLPFFAGGDARSLGLDVFVKKRIQNHEFWMAYSLGQVEERFAVNQRRLLPYKEAPQSQRHEFKIAAVLNFSPFYLTLTNVNGSGFTNNTVEVINQDLVPYWRTDIAAQYRFRLNKLRFQAGFSILNVFNRSNVRLNQSVNVPDGSIINTIGIPFTPTFYLNVGI
ncbi:hypothetical protein BKI52_38585 [marine bacterium AO1-C]|nr:hypothetical protein BKI52_38585 [marine bacterium AO1-C]